MELVSTKAFLKNLVDHLNDFMVMNMQVRVSAYPLSIKLQKCTVDGFGLKALIVVEQFFLVLFQMVREGGMFFYSKSFSTYKPFKSMSKIYRALIISSLGF